MSLVDSPEFGEHSENEPSLDPTPSGKRSWTTIVISVLAVAILLSGLLLVLSRQQNSTGSGSVTLRGKIVNGAGAVVPDALVYVDGMDAGATSDENGDFSISNAPQGQQYLVIGVTPEPPHFVTVMLVAGETNDVGQIVLE